MISLDRKMMTPVINSTRSACAVDYHFKTGKIFWSDVMEEKIYRYIKREIKLVTETLSQ